MKLGSIATAVVALTSVVALSACGGQDDSKDNSAAAPAAPATSASTSSGNGVADLTGAEILTKTKAALKAAKSYHVKGSVTNEGQKFDLDLKVAGENLIGYFGTKEGKVELLAVGKQRFYKPDAKFWKATGGAQGATVAEVVGDRWVKVDPSDTSSSELFGIANIDELLDNEGTVNKGAVKTVDGRQAIALTDTTDKSGGTLYVATEGEPYPVRLEGPTAADGGLAFSEYGATFADIKAPAAADIFDLKKLGGK
ncbi:hypothetical protein AB0J83_40740 [Actinoplanes sp. NPDC049596]|uniref:hypothetical protein n=1 Tax=unclassified Actinoplanes TaxID=2626549 RepID=UPI00341F4DAF